jgi:hypothetical protein
MGHNKLYLELGSWNRGIIRNGETVNSALLIKNNKVVGEITFFEDEKAPKVRIVACDATYSLNLEFRQTGRVL